MLCSSNSLCDILAAFARRLCTSFVDPNSLYPFLASRLIPLDKNPRVRPIAVGESVRHILGKTLLCVVQADILEVAGTSQLCAGQGGGCEAAVHAVCHLFESPDCEAILFVDASNAFNLLNCQLALRNTLHLCLSLASVAINCYHKEVPLFIEGEVVSSSEGTTQGDPLSMALYVIATLPLICQLENCSCNQVWYADDAAGDGGLSSV